MTIARRICSLPGLCTTELCQRGHVLDEEQLTLFANSG
jgi:hypothetical protein